MNPDTTYQLRGLRQASYLWGWVWRVDGLMPTERPDGAQHWSLLLFPRCRRSSHPQTGTEGAWPLSAMRAPGTTDAAESPPTLPLECLVGQGTARGRREADGQGQSRIAPMSFSLRPCRTQARYCPPGPWGPIHPLPTLLGHRGDGESSAAGLCKGQVARVAPPW